MAGTAREGMKTFDNARFLRLSWEIAPAFVGRGHHWVPFAKGGAFALFLGPTDWLLNWNRDGAEPRAVNERVNGSTAQVRQASTYWYRSGATYTYRSQLGFSARVLPLDHIFSNSGPAILVEPDKGTAVSSLFLLGWLNSRLIRALAQLQANFGKFLTGIFKAMPWVEPDRSTRVQVEGAVEAALAALIQNEMRRETSPYYCGPFPCETFDEAIENTVRMARRRDAAINGCVDSCSAVIDALYAIDSSGWGDDVLGTTKPDYAWSNVTETEAASSRNSVAAELAREHVSWAVGVALGRWCGTHVVEALPDLDPFARLPVAPPATSRPAAELLAVRDSGHPADLSKTVEAALAEAFNSDFARAVLHQNGNNIDWLSDSGAAGFFSWHIARYSNAERQSPVYWALGTPSANYVVWLYYRHITEDTFYRILHDFVEPKLAHEERVLADNSGEFAGDSSAGRRKERANQESLVRELRAFRVEISRIAPLWKPNLCDGVTVNAAPLWRLFSHHRPWQKECKATWDKLCKGDYDWAHLAMHLWPERVVPKCAEDRSLAIAHGLEDVFWYEDSDGKWQPREVAESEVDKLVKERTSAAVKDALKSLLEAPAPATGRATRKKAPRAKGTRKRAASARPKAATNGAASSSRSSAAVDAELLSKVKAAIGSNGDGASKADVIDATGISASEWNKAIKALLADGSVTQTGERRGARYHVAVSIGVEG